MMDLLAADLDKEMQVAETEEQDAQADYEQMQKDAAAKRAADSTSLTEKAAAKGEVESQLQAHKDSKAADSSELMATLQVIAQTHASCDCSSNILTFARKRATASSRASPRPRLF